MKKIQINIDWGVVFWFGILTIFLWLMAKAVGLIHTPWYVEIIPIVGGLITILAIVHEAGRYVQKIDTLVENMTEIKSEVKNVDKRLVLVEHRLGVFETKLS